MVNKVTLEFNKESIKVAIPIQDVVFKIIYLLPVWLKNILSRHYILGIQTMQNHLEG